jgi:cobalt-precorrin-5B (C1)-methyltransferase
VTRPGLPLPPGKPAINPVSRQIIRTAIAAAPHSGFGDVIIAGRTMNGRPGILGARSILGTTGIVVPEACLAWIPSSHRGIDVVRGATGGTSEAAIARLHGPPEQALFATGDFVGEMLKCQRQHPVPLMTIAGGVAKISRLGPGLLDPRSRRSEVNLVWLTGCVMEARDAGVDLPARVMEAAWRAAAAMPGRGVLVEIVIFDRSGQWLAGSGFRAAHESLGGFRLGRKRR